MVFLLSPVFIVGHAMAGDDCGERGTMTIKAADGKTKIQAVTRVFRDGSIAVRARLAVNPDGAAASYAVGDGGFTYIANGMDRWKDGIKTSYQTASCRADFLAAEERGFGPGTASFCVYALEVVPFAAAGKITACGTGKSVIGNGLGKPRMGGTVESVGRTSVQTYVSTTSIRHTVNGDTRYIDSAALPVAVTPLPKLLGKVAWVGGSGFKPTLAVLGDVGPAFGEGSIALHQLLRWGSVEPQKPGPIPIEQRCSKDELAIRSAFISSPDASNDWCRKGYKARSKSDVRAYAGIEEMLDFVVLGKTGLLKSGSSIIATEVSLQALKEASAEYTDEMIQRMLACLPR